MQPNRYLLIWRSADNGLTRTRIFARLGDARRKAAALQLGKPKTRRRKANAPVPAGDLQIKEVKAVADHPLVAPPGERIRRPRGTPISPASVVGILEKLLDPGTLVPNSSAFKKEFPNIRVRDYQAGLSYLRSHVDDPYSQFKLVDPTNPTKSPIVRVG